MLSFDSVWFVLYAVLMFNNTIPNNHAWLITDGKIGDQVHCLAIAEALKISYEERVVKPPSPWSWIMPYGPIPFMHQQRFERSPIHGNLPSMIIASGRRTVAYVRHLKSKHPKIKTIFLKDPRTAYHYFDVIWSPWHDNLNQPNVITTLTSPNILTEQTLAKADRSIFNDLPKPCVGIILGDLFMNAPKQQHQKILNDFINRLTTLKQQIGSFIITPSRRTPQNMLQTMLNAIQDVPHWCWSGKGLNPYAAILAHADALVVTGDSHNMVSESLVVGCPVMVHTTPFLKKKCLQFLAQIHQLGWINYFNGSLSNQRTTPINATHDIVKHIRQMLHLPLHA